MMKTRFVHLALVAGLSLFSGVALAQNGSSVVRTAGYTSGEFKAPTDAEIQLLRQDVRSLKKQIIAMNLTLTDGEAQRFWPVYDRFTADLSKINDKKLALINEYASKYETLTNEQADHLLDARAAVEEDSIQLRRKYIPLFRKVLSGRTTALFFQIEWQVNLMIDLQLASELPLIEQ